MKSTSNAWIVVADAHEVGLSGLRQALRGLSGGAIQFHPCVMKHAPEVIDQLCPSWHAEENHAKKYRQCDGYKHHPDKVIQRRALTGLFCTVTVRHIKS